MVDVCPRDVSYWIMGSDALLTAAPVGPGYVADLKLSILERLSSTGAIPSKRLSGSLRPQKGGAGLYRKAVDELVKEGKVTYVVARSSRGNLCTYVALA